MNKLTYVSTNSTALIYTTLIKSQTALHTLVRQRMGDNKVLLNPKHI